MGGKPKRVINQPFTDPRNAPIANASMIRTGAEAPGHALPTKAHTMPVSARLEATERSMPRVSNTSI